MIVALAGGVGGAKLAQGLYGVLPPGKLAVVVNTADDFSHFGLHISPDLDTVLYTLAGIANPATGWGIAGDTFEAMTMFGRYGQEEWFRLGDRDLATHVLRTQSLRRGMSLTDITRELASHLGVTAQVLPMCDEPVATLVDTAAGQLEFQDYFVRRHHQDTVIGVTFAGSDRARVTGPVAVALATADGIILCPSNPIVSISPILDVPGMRDLLVSASVPRVAVSPIVGGEAVKGPAAHMLAALGHDVSPLGVARLYAGLIDGIVIDDRDITFAPAIEALGIAVLPTQSIMGDTADRERLAGEVLAWCGELAPRVKVPA